MIIACLYRTIIEIPQFFMLQDILYMRINKKYANFMLQRSSPLLKSSDYTVIIFKFGKRKIPMFYLSIYRDE